MTAAENYSGADIKTILAQRGLDGSGGQYLCQCLEQVSAEDVENALSKPAGLYSFDKLLTFLSPAAEDYLEQMVQMAQQLTVRRFGRTIRLYAPLYLSNHCINSCLYCGFNRETDFVARRLTIEQVVNEAEIIASEGFRDILLVSSEDRDFITVDYLVELAGRLRENFSSISVEIYQLSTAEYAKLFAAGIEGVTLYQETYDRQVYAYYHPAGPKADYENRLTAADSMGAAGMREIGLGALLGLGDWRAEALALGEHAHYLIKRYWQSHVSFSFPRVRPAHDVNMMQFKHLPSDKNLLQMIIALRLCFADAGLVLSTRERPELRDWFIKVGVTRISAGSKTSPGGYSQKTSSTEQFKVDDTRSPAEIAAMIRSHGLEPVWKDWDAGFIRGI